VAKAAKQTPVSSNVMARAKAHAESPASKDKLDAVRAKVKEARDIDFSIQSLNERLSLLSKRKQELVHNELPDLFQDAKIDVLGIEPEGNMPGYDTELKDFYHANIPEARRDEAFAWLDKNKHGDMIKTVITVELGRGDRKTAKAVEQALRKLEVSYSSKLSVPWNTLTAFVKEQVEKGAVLPLDILGATVGRVVKLKARKD
jgi:hypothetical protein